MLVWHLLYFTGEGIPGTCSHWAEVAPTPRESSAGAQQSKLTFLTNRKDFLLPAQHQVPPCSHCGGLLHIVDKHRPLVATYGHTDHNLCSYCCATHECPNTVLFRWTYYFFLNHCFLLMTIFIPLELILQRVCQITYLHISCASVPFKTI